VAKRNPRGKKTTTTQRPVRRRKSVAKQPTPAPEPEAQPTEPAAPPILEAPPAPPPPRVALTRDAGFGAGILEPEAALSVGIQDETPPAPKAINQPTTELRRLEDARADEATDRPAAGSRQGRRGKFRRDHREESGPVEIASVEAIERVEAAPEAADLDEAPPPASRTARDQQPAALTPERGERTWPDRQDRRGGWSDSGRSPDSRRPPSTAPSPVVRADRPEQPVSPSKADSFAEMIDFEEPADEADSVETAPDRETARPSSRGKAARAEPADKTPTEKREMLINVSDTDECRIALLCEGRLEELYIERATATSNVGNIYKGRVTNVEPSIQAAFIDFGLPLNGFLHISDLHPKYFPESRGEPELVGKKTPRRHRPPIQSCLRRGQEIVVQVIKEGIGTKGPTLSSYISLPGRFLVMMPDMDQLGVSRKIEDEEQRRQLREALAQLSLPKGMGFIVRTAGVDRNKRDLQRDLNYLARLWRKVVLRLKKEPAPAELYKESDLVIRTIRDLYDSSLSRIIVDSPTVAGRVRDFLSIASPRSQDAVVEYSGPEPMFHRYGIESEIDKLNSKNVPLPCGGSLVIESTEALVAIDVNSGRFRVPENAEETAYRVNIEAVDEIARQLRLRDLGGLIICDLIDMTQDRHRRVVEKRLADALKKHKERAKLLRISRFGILEMTRQRQRPSFAKSIFRECPRCNGSGRVKTAESAGLDVMRQIRMASQRTGVASVDVSVSAQVAHDLLNRKRHQLTDLERATGQTIRIHAKEDLNMDDVQISCADRRGRDVPLSSAEQEAVRAAGPGRPNGRQPGPRQASQPPRHGESSGDRRPPHQDHRQRDQRRDSNGQRRGRRRGRRGGR